MGIFDSPVAVDERGGAAVLLIDADYLGYMLGSICQSEVIPIALTGCTRECVDEEAGTYVWAYPVQLVEWNVDNAITKIKDRLGCDSIEVYLTGDGNFRDEVAVTKPYKGTRKTVRPFHWRRVREYMVSKWGAVVIEGMEADDQVCIRQLALMQEGQQSVIVSNDKDLLTMTGAIFNPRTGQLVYSTPDAAARFFWGQMVCGDSVDNIAGLKGCGPAWLKKRSYLPTDQLRDTIVSEYMVRHDYDYLLEQGTLLHMRRTPDEQWNPDYDYTAGYRGVEEFPGMSEWISGVQLREGAVSR